MSFFCLCFTRRRRLSFITLKIIKKRTTMCPRCLIKTDKTDDSWNKIFFIKIDACLVGGKVEKEPFIYLIWHHSIKAVWPQRINLTLIWSNFFFLLIIIALVFLAIVVWVVYAQNCFFIVTPFPFSAKHTIVFVSMTQTIPYITT